MYKVYLLDDERWILKGIEGLVDWSSMGMTVSGVQINSSKAIEEIEQIKPDIVITDIQMPHINGLELIEQLKLNGFAGVFIIISGYADFSYVQKAMSYDVVEYCLKPLEADDLKMALARAVQKLGDEKLLNSLTVREEAVESKNKTFTEILTYIKNHFTESLTLHQLAEDHFLNTTYLSALFTKELGISYSSYIAGMRLEFACRLLEETDLSITEIAEKSGFSNYFYFARVFKKKFSMTPGDFRADKQIQEP